MMRVMGHFHSNTRSVSMAPTSAGSFRLLVACCFFAVLFSVSEPAVGRRPSPRRVRCFVTWSAAGSIAECSHTRQSRCRVHRTHPGSTLDRRRPRCATGVRGGVDQDGTASDRLSFMRRVAAIASSMSAAARVLTGQAKQADAFCGEPYPYWAYYTDFDEMMVPFEFEGYAGNLFARMVGNKKEQDKADHHPLIIIPGGPGLPHDYLETLEGASKDDRVVILFDPIGTGNSSALPANVRSSASGLLGTSSLVAQIDAVVNYLKLDEFHVLGHGTGAEAALDLGRSLGKPGPRPPGPAFQAVLSVTLASPLLGGSELAADYLERIRSTYADEVPVCFETAMQARSTESFAGGVAALKQQSRSTASSAGPLSCPVLITYGGRDVVGEEIIAELKRDLSGGDRPVREACFADSGHLPHLDDREGYVTSVQGFINSVDETWRST